VQINLFADSANATCLIAIFPMELLSSGIASIRILLNHQPPEAQAALYRQPLQEVLEQPAPKLQQWVARGYRYFTQQQKAERKWATMHTPDIRTFFQPPAQHPNDLQPP